jgi:prophage antirepressor-like protein
MSNLSIMTVGGVECYEQDGIVYLRLDTVARGLGFTRVAESGNEVIRWERVNKYLSEFGCVPTRGHDGEYIPENVFYRLAMKAKNEAAEKFQALVADEIIPSIRKTGGYQMQAPQMTQLEVLAATAQALVEQERRMNAIEASVSSMDKKLDNLVDVLSAPKTTEAERWQRETHKAITSFCQENKLSYRDFYDSLYEQLEERAHVNLSSRVTRRQNRARCEGASRTEIYRITKLFMVSIDPKLRLIFDSLVTEFKIAYALKGATT